MSTSLRLFRASVEGGDLLPLRRLRVPVRVVVPAVVDALDHAAPAQVPPAVLALVRRLLP